METIKDVIGLVASLALAVLIFAILYAGVNVVINLLSNMPLMTNL